MVVQDTLPEGVTYVVDSALPSGAVFDEVTGTLTWSGIELAAGVSESFTFMVDVSAGTAGDSLANTVAAEGNETDPDLTNNSFAQTSTVNSVDLSVTKAADDETPNEGQTATYTITASNAASSNAPATGVIVQDTLPVGVTYVVDSATPSGAVFDEAIADAIPAGNTSTTQTIRRCNRKENIEHRSTWQRHATSKVVKLIPLRDRQEGEA